MNGEHAQVHLRAHRVAVDLERFLPLGFRPIELAHPEQRDAQENSRGHSGGTTRAGLRRVLLLLEVSLTVVLLVGAGLLLRSYQRLRSTDIGVPVDPSPMDFSAWFEVYLGGAWHTLDARHNAPRIGRILMARGRDATDAAISTAFGTANLLQFDVVTREFAIAG